MQTLKIEATPRADFGKKASRAIRREGQVPCVLYGGGETVSFSVDAKALKPLIYTPNSYIVELTIGGKTLQLFPDGFNSLLFYFICVLWAVVLAACLLFGSGFAFYAMFAAIAVELIGAVYYTFQLK